MQREAAAAEARHRARGQRVREWCRKKWPRFAEKSLQAYLNVSEATAERILAGKVSREMIDLLADKEGWDFIQFVYEPVCGPLKIMSYSAMGARRQAEDICFAFTHDGMMRLCPNGFAAFVRGYLGLTAGPQDFASYATRNMGWCEAVERADGAMVIRYSAGIDPQAAARARDWIATTAPLRVERIVERSGQWVRHEETAGEAIEALDRAGLIAAAQDTGWHIERLPLDNIRDRAQAELIKAAQQTSRNRDELIRIATDLDLMPRSALFQVRGTAIRALWIGPGLDVNWSTYIGRDLMERDDTEYTSIVRAHLLDAIDCGEPTFHRMRGTIDGRSVDYERIAIAEASNSNERLVLTSSHLLHRKAAA